MGCSGTSSIGQNVEPIDNMMTVDVSTGVDDDQEMDIPGDSADESLDLSANAHLLDESVVQYIAGYVIKRILDKNFDCNTCTPLLLDTPDLSSLIKIKERGTLHYPSKDVINVCFIVEAYIKKFETDGKLFVTTDILKVLSNKSYSTVISKYPNIFETSDCKYHLRVDIVILKGFLG